jgi:hypothetical protein
MLVLARTRQRIDVLVIARGGAGLASAGERGRSRDASEREATHDADNNPERAAHHDILKQRGGRKWGGRGKSLVVELEA